MTQIPYGGIERDLSALVSKRVSEAIASVLQLTDGPGQAYIIAIAAGNTAVSSWAGAMAAFHGTDISEMSMPEMLEAFAEVMREATAHREAT